MLSKEDNELLCRVGRGTPMGNLIREYWIPALTSAELPEADGAPLRLRLLPRVIDREAQKTTSYTGIAGIHQQDQAVTESMGAIIDRTEEHLGTSDAMVIRARRRVHDAARALRDRGVPPPGVDYPGVYLRRSGGVILPGDADWIEATRELRRASGDARPADALAPA
jgi:hypothetical protein